MEVQSSRLKSSCPAPSSSVPPPKDQPTTPDLIDLELPPLMPGGLGVKEKHRTGSTSSSRSQLDKIRSSLSSRRSSHSDDKDKVKERDKVRKEEPPPDQSCQAAHEGKEE